MHISNIGLNIPSTMVFDPTQVTGKYLFFYVYFLLMVLFVFFLIALKFTHHGHKIDFSLGETNHYEVKIIHLNFF